MAAPPFGGTLTDWSDGAYRWVDDAYGGYWWDPGSGDVWDRVAVQATRGGEIDAFPAPAAAPQALVDEVDFFNGMANAGAYAPAATPPPASIGNAFATYAGGTVYPERQADGTYYVEDPEILGGYYYTTDDGQVWHPQYGWRASRNELPRALPYPDPFQVDAAVRVTNDASSWANSGLANPAFVDEATGWVWDSAVQGWVDPTGGHAGQVYRNDRWQAAVRPTLTFAQAQAQVDQANAGLRSDVDAYQDFWGSILPPTQQEIRQQSQAYLDDLAAWRALQDGAEEQQHQAYVAAVDEASAGWVDFFSAIGQTFGEGMADRVRANPPTTPAASRQLAIDLFRASGGLAAEIRDDELAGLSTEEIFRHAFDIKGGQGHLPGWVAPIIAKVLETPIPFWAPNLREGELMAHQWQLGDLLEPMLPDGAYSAALGWLPDGVIEEFATDFAKNVTSPIGLMTLPLGGGAGTMARTIAANLGAEAVAAAAGVAGEEAGIPKPLGQVLGGLGAAGVAGLRGAGPLARTAGDDLGPLRSVAADDIVVTRKGVGTLIHGSNGRMSLLRTDGVLLDLVDDDFVLGDLRRIVGLGDDSGSVRFGGLGDDSGTPHVGGFADTVGDGTPGVARTAGGGTADIVDDVARRAGAPTGLADDITPRTVGGARVADDVTPGTGGGVASRVDDALRSGDDVVPPARVPGPEAPEIRAVPGEPNSVDVVVDGTAVARVEALPDGSAVVRAPDPQDVARVVETRYASAAGAIDAVADEAVEARVAAEAVVNGPAGKVAITSLRDAAASAGKTVDQIVRASSGSELAHVIAEATGAPVTVGTREGNALVAALRRGVRGGRLPALVVSYPQGGVRAAIARDVPAMPDDLELAPGARRLVGRQSAFPGQSGHPFRVFASDPDNPSPLAEYLESFLNRMLRADSPEPVGVREVGDIELPLPDGDVMTNVRGGYHAAENGRPAWIEIRRDQPTRRLTLLHEAAHHIATDILPRRGITGLETAPELAAWWKAITESRIYQEAHEELQAVRAAVHELKDLWKAMPEELREPIPEELLALRDRLWYQVDPEELFVRSLAQHLVTHSGDEELLMELQHFLNSQELNLVDNSQWVWDEFVPIGRAFDQLLSEWGWFELQ